MAPGVVKLFEDKKLEERQSKTKIYQEKNLNEGKYKRVGIG